MVTPNEIHDELKGALGDARENFRDVRCDVFTDDEVLNEARVIDVLTQVLGMWDDILPYLTQEEAS